MNCNDARQAVGPVPTVPGAGPNVAAGEVEDLIKFDLIR